MTFNYCPVGKRMMRVDVEGRRRKGRPKRGWTDRVNVDLREKRLSGEGCVEATCQKHRRHMELG